MSPRQPMAALALACLVLASACGPGAVAQHARAILVVTQAHRAAEEAVTVAREAAMDRVEAAHPADPEHDAAIRAEAGRWAPVAAALDAVQPSLRAWLAAVQLAHAAGGGEAWLGEALALGLRTLALWGPIVAIAAELDVVLPEMPALPALLSSVGGVQ